MDQFLKDTIRKAGAIALEHFKNGAGITAEKSHAADVVTQADTDVSDFLVAAIQKEYPDHAIFSEEVDGIINEGAEYTWVIDPIDGTRNFAMGVPFWCNLVALVKDGETIMGAMYNPLEDDLFFAEKGKGAYKNDVRLHVNNKTELDHAFGVFISAYAGGVYGDLIERFRKARVRLSLETTSWVHNYGSMLITGYIASGGVDYSSGNAGMEWDFRAPFLICEEAGAKITDSDGNPWKPGRQDYVIANPDLHPKIMHLFRP